jgi:transcriptional regulator with XRE-family HTH domain
MLQGELADRAGISASFLSKLEHGVYPDVRVSTLYRLAKALGYDVRIEFTPKR